MNALYWRGLFNQSGLEAVISELDTLSTIHQDDLVAAMQFAFEDQHEDIASHIDRNWRGLLPMDKLENGADWVNREVLLFIRGKKSEFWLSLLFSNNGHAQRHPFAIVFQEAENSLRSGAEFPIERIEQFFSLAIAHGIRTEDKNDADYLSALPAALAVVPLLHSQTQEIKERWRGLLVQIENNNNRLMQFDEYEDALVKAISSGDAAMIQQAASVFVRIPEKDRRTSPFSYMLQKARGQADYPLVDCLSALSEAGLSTSAPQICGATPIFELMCEPDLDSTRLHDALDYLLSTGASVDTLQYNSIFNASSEMTHCLHMAVYLNTPPFDVLRRGVSTWDPIDSQGLTPLLYACREVKTDVANALLDQGANPTVSSLGLNTALHELFDYAIMDFLDINCEQDKVAQLAGRLRSMGLDPLAINDQGQDALVSMCKGASSNDRVGKCLLLLKELRALDWPMQSEKMLKALPGTGVNDVSRFLLADIQRQALDRDTPTLQSRPNRRPGL